MKTPDAFKFSWPHPVSSKHQDQLPCRRCLCLPGWQKVVITSNDALDAHPTCKQTCLLQWPHADLGSADYAVWLQACYSSGWALLPQQQHSCPKHQIQQIYLTCTQLATSSSASSTLTSCPVSPR